jgi:hypothetical protein
MKDDIKKDLNLKKFEVKYRMHENGTIEKAIFIDGEKLDYSIDVDAYRKLCAMGPEYQAVAEKDIERHFIESISEFIGKNLTAEDIANAIKTGWI